MSVVQATADSAPKLFDIPLILKKKGNLELYYKRFFSWRWVNDRLMTRTNPSQLSATHDVILFTLRARTRWRIFFVVAMHVAMEQLISLTECSQALAVVASLQAILQTASVDANHVGNIRLYCLS